MKIFKNILISSISIILMGSCSEQGLELFDSTLSGNSIYFVEQFEKKDDQEFNRPISFGFVPASVTDSLIKIRVRTTGPVYDTDRPIQIHVADTSSMKEGTHFDYVSAPRMRAGHTTDTIYIKMYRTAELTTKRLYLNLQLQSNAYFATNIPVNKNNQINQDLLHYRLYVDDLFPQSYLWTTFIGSAAVKSQFGPYSRRKTELILEVLNIPDYIFFDPESGGVSVGQLTNWSSYMKYWLTKEKQEGRIYYDENGVEIQMGPAAK